MSTASRETIRKLKDFWLEYRRYKIGLLGLGLLIMFAAVTVFAPYLANPDDIKYWHSSEYWVDYPVGALPEWYNLFSPSKGAVQERITDYNIYTNRTIANKFRLIEFSFNYTYTYDLPPRDLVLKLSLTFNASNPPIYTMKIVRPDGNEIVVAQQQKIQVSGKDIVTYNMRISVDKLPNINLLLFNFARNYEDPSKVSETQPEKINPMIVLFSRAEEGIIDGSSGPLKGNYKVFMRIIFMNVSDKLEPRELLVKDYVFGLLGTDDRGRDLWSGIVYGTQWALLIGLITSIFSTVLGVVIGVTSGYVGGVWDEIIQRVTQVFYAMPVLPILIVLAAHPDIGPSIWNIILMLIIFGWSGVAVVTRSMALQIKSELYVESAKAIGAGGTRIVLKYIMPQVLPYTFATIALSVPGAILYEAALSYLGLGDPKIVTWGKILEDANAGQAMLKQMWWWVIPPGLMIALVGLTFVFIGNALDAVLNPKLKK